MVTLQGTPRAGVSAQKIRAVVAATLKALKRPRSDVALLFVTDSHIERLNTRFRNKPRPTDILSFPAHLPPKVELGGQASHGTMSGDLGDIFIAPAWTRHKAAQRGLTYKQYLVLLIVHGLLHLVGHDHKTKKEWSKMERKEKAILKKINA